MIRAILQNGEFRPLDPVPADWTEGQHVHVLPAEDEVFDDDTSLEQWYRELVALGSMDKADGETMRRVLEEADRAAKDAIRREMGLT